MWKPVLLDSKGSLNDAALWLDKRGLKRGDRENRNDWLYPAAYLFLFRDEDVAIEFRLTFGR